MRTQWVVGLCLLVALLAAALGFVAGYSVRPPVSSRFHLYSATVEETSPDRAVERKKLFKIDVQTGQAWEYESFGGNFGWTEVPASFVGELLQRSSQRK